MQRTWIHGLVALVIAMLAWAPPVEAQRRPRRRRTPAEQEQPERPRRRRSRRAENTAAPDAVAAAPVQGAPADVPAPVALPGNPYPHEAPPEPPPAVALPGNPYHPEAPQEGAPTALPPGRRFGALSEDEILEALRNGPIQALNNVGNTSVNLRVDLPGEIDGSYKPSEERHPEHFRAEIAAFRVNQLLGLERVPPAVFRRVSRESLPHAERYGIFFANDQARGAMIYWVPVLRSAGISSPEAAEYWMNLLLVGSRITPRDRARAEEVSTLLVFDFLIANWDRWNGLNTLQDGTGHLVYRDNNGGFQEPLAPFRYDRVLRQLRRSQRFSRQVIDRARALTLDSLRQAMTADAVGTEPLLTDVQLRGVLRRRDTLIGYIEELIARYGEDQVYAFP